MSTTLRLLLGLLGVSAVLISLSIFLRGAAATAGDAETAYDLLTGTHQAATGAWPATMDGELRFYAPFWGVYGLLLLDATHDLSRWLDRIPLLAAVFFAGGVGRAISFLTIGLPHPVFILLMAIELVLPPVYVLLWYGIQRPHRT